MLDCFGFQLKRVGEYYRKYAMQGSALGQALFSSSVTVLNDGLATRLATRPGKLDGVRDVASNSSSDATSTRWDVLGARGSDHLIRIVLMPKRKFVRLLGHRYDFKYFGANKKTSDLLFSFCQKTKQQTRKTDCVQLPWWKEFVKG